MKLKGLTILQLQHNIYENSFVLESHNLKTFYDIHSGAAHNSKIFLRCFKTCTLYF